MRKNAYPMGAARTSRGAREWPRASPLRSKHARLVDAVHKLGDLPVAEVPETPPISEGIGRCVWDLGLQLVPDVERLLLHAKLAVNRGVFYVREEPVTLRVLPGHFQRVTVVAVQIVGGVSRTRLNCGSLERNNRYCNNCRSYKQSIHFKPVRISDLLS